MYIHVQYNTMWQTDAQAVPWAPLFVIVKLSPKELLQRQAREGADCLLSALLSSTQGRALPVSGNGVFRIVRNGFRPGLSNPGRFCQTP